MKKSVSFIFVAAFALGVVLPIRAAAQDAGAGNRASAVFVMSNSAEKNEVIAFTRTAEGTLEESGHFATGGRGSGGNTDPLESQGSLTLTRIINYCLPSTPGAARFLCFASWERRWRWWIE